VVPHHLHRRRRSPRGVHLHEAGSARREGRRGLHQGLRGVPRRLGALGSRRRDACGAGGRERRVRGVADVENPASQHMLEKRCLAPQNSQIAAGQFTPVGMD
jgi:hypothetical protein